MTKYKKESLEKLLILIDEISDNEETIWFKRELQKRFGSNHGTNNKSVAAKLDLQISNIEKYLKLDGYTIIDYSSIANETVRAQLFRDCIEMSKYRLGKINDTISFDEYCRYAHLQAEELINYFYTEKFVGNIENIVQFVKTHLPRYDPKGTIFSLNQISYVYKFTAFTMEYDLTKGPMKETLEFVSHLRNEMSHRNSLEVKEEDGILVKVKVRGHDVTKNYIDFSTTSKMEKDLFKKARFIHNKRKQDYDLILKSLCHLKEAVVILLKR